MNDKIEESTARQQYFWTKLCQVKRSLDFTRGDRYRTHQVFIVQLGKDPATVPALDLYDRQIRDLESQADHYAKLVQEEEAFQAEQIDSENHPIF